MGQDGTSRRALPAKTAKAVNGSSRPGYGFSERVEKNIEGATFTWKIAVKMLCFCAL